MPKKVTAFLLIQAALAQFGDVDLSNLAGASGYKLVGSASNDNLGVLSAAGDFNGDEIGDIVVAEVGISISSAGRVAVVFGQMGTPFTIRDMSTFTPGKVACNW